MAVIRSLAGIVKDDPSRQVILTRQQKNDEKICETKKLHTYLQPISFTI